MPILDLEKILKSLQAENVQYILVGGMAAIGHGMNYSTSDVDIHIIHLDDLIKAKRVAGRSKDKVHLLELEAIRDIQKVQKKDL